MLGTERALATGRLGGQSCACGRAGAAVRGTNQTHTHLQLDGVGAEAQLRARLARRRQRAPHAVDRHRSAAEGQRHAEHGTQRQPWPPSGGHRQLGGQAGQEEGCGGVGRQRLAAGVRCQQLLHHLERLGEEGLPAVRRQDAQHLRPALDGAALARGGAERGVVRAPADAVQPAAVAAGERERELGDDQVGRRLDAAGAQREAEADCILHRGRAAAGPHARRREAAKGREARRRRRAAALLGGGRRPRDEEGLEQRHGGPGAPGGLTGSPYWWRGEL